MLWNVFNIIYFIFHDRFTINYQLNSRLLYTTVYFSHKHNYTGVSQ